MWEGLGYQDDTVFLHVRNSSENLAVAMSQRLPYTAKPFEVSNLHQQRTCET